MGCIVAQRRKALQELPQLKKKIAMVGLDGAGKTTILQQMKVNQFMETVPTIGLNIETVKYKSLEFLVFDIGGKVRSLWSHYYENIDAIIFVIDSTDKERIMVVKDELVKLNGDIQFQNCPVLALFNKQDCQNKIEFQTLIQETGINDVLENDVIVIKCSALTGEGLWEGLDKLVNYFTSNNQPIKKPTNEIQQQQMLKESQQIQYDPKQMNIPQKYLQPQLDPTLKKVLD